MQSLNSVRELRNRKRYNTARSTVMSENNGPESNPAMNSQWTNENEEPENRNLKQELIEQIKSFIVSLTRQLNDLTRLVRG